MCISLYISHQYKPLGTDLIDELEEAELGEDWVKPVVKRNTPIWYGNQMKKLVKEGKVSRGRNICMISPGASISKPTQPTQSC